MHLCCDYWTQVLYLSVIAIITLLLIISLALRLTTRPVPVIHRTDNEHYYYDPKSRKQMPFPSVNIEDEPSVYLSVVVPAYNEETRLPVMLDETLAYLEGRCRSGRTPTDKHPVFTYEIIVVDDGSDDRTSEVGHDYAHRYGSDKIRVLQLDYNRGKGGAVQLGVLSTRGRLILFADADGATRFADFAKLEEYLWSNWPADDSTARPVIAIGSRSHLQSEAVATRSLFRTVLMHGFHFGVRLLAVRTVRDTQCGFKLFERRLAYELFTHCHCQKWAFDVELLLLAEHIGADIGEVDVNWKEIDGSKVVPFWSWLQMGKDVAIISLKYMIGACRYPSLPNDSGHQKSD